MFIDEFAKEIRTIFFVYNRSILNESLLINTIPLNNVIILTKRIVSIDKYYFIGIIIYKNIEYNSITYLNKKYSLNRIYLKNKYENVLCLTTFINYNKVKELLTFLQHYINIGINLFVIYKTNCSNEIDKILYKYFLKGLIRIIKDDFTYKSRIFKYGNYLHVLKHNDCYYRYKYLAKHILFVDQDELLTTSHKSLLITKHKVKYDVYYYFTILNVKYENRYNLSLCPKSVWKYYIYNTKCIESIDIHRVKLKQKCKYYINNFSNDYILHNRKSFPWYYKICKSIENIQTM